MTASYGQRKAEDRRENSIRCFSCREWKTDAEYQLVGKYRRQDCKPCWNTAKRSRYTPNQHRKHSLKYKFGITEDDYTERLRAQSGECAICGATDPGSGHEFFSVDHDHVCCPGRRSCGACIRGLLCTSCNTGIGLLGDAPIRLRDAADYLDLAALTAPRKEGIK